MAGRSNTDLDFRSRVEGKNPAVIFSRMAAGEPRTLTALQILGKAS